MRHPWNKELKPVIFANHIITIRVSCPANPYMSALFSQRPYPFVIAGLQTLVYSQVDRTEISLSLKARSSQLIHEFALGSRSDELGQSRSAEHLLRRDQTNGHERMRLRGISTGRGESLCRRLICELETEPS